MFEYIIVYVIVNIFPRQLNIFSKLLVCCSILQAYMLDLSIRTVCKTRIIVMKIVNNSEIHCILYYSNEIEPSTLFLLENQITVSFRRLNTSACVFSKTSKICNLFRTYLLYWHFLPYISSLQLTTNKCTHSRLAPF